MSFSDVNANIRDSVLNPYQEPIITRTGEIDTLEAPQIQIPSLINTENLNTAVISITVPPINNEIIPVTLRVKYSKGDESDDIEIPEASNDVEIPITELTDLYEGNSTIEVFYEVQDVGSYVADAQIIKDTIRPVVISNTLVTVPDPNDLTDPNSRIAVYAYLELTFSEDIVIGQQDAIVANITVGSSPPSAINKNLTDNNNRQAGTAFAPPDTSNVVHIFLEDIEYNQSGNPQHSYDVTIDTALVEG